MTELKRNIGVVIVTAICAMATAFAAENKEEKSQGYLDAQAKLVFSAENVAKRTAPVGSVYVEGDDVPVAEAPAAPVSDGPRTGADVYAAACAACHGAGVGGAPAYGAADWTTRNALGLETLLQSVVNGKGIMPAKGGCANCSDDELTAAVEHLMASAP